jgi:LysR family glycine cleavage system transcriptional activator
MHRPQDLLAVPLIHHGHRPWSLWFTELGLTPPPQIGLTMEDSVMVLEAAAQGLGVALGRSGLIEADLASGRLVRPVAGDVASDLGFFAVWRADNRKVARISMLRDWLVAETTPQTMS